MVSADPRPGMRNTRALLAAIVGMALGLATPHAVAAAAPAQRHFASAEEAAQALADALKADDTKSVLAILGTSAKPLIDSGDAVADREGRDRFVTSYAQLHSLSMEGQAKAILVVGTNDWPFPIPLVKDAAGWRFDTAAGKSEILNRRIGRNELAAIQSCLAYVDAQREYYSLDPDGSSLLHYAQKLASSPGKRDGLYWDTAPGEPDSPLGPEFAAARAQGYAPGTGKGAPYHGYHFHSLTAQGPDAPGGAYDYIAHGAMIGGFALVAYPATYDNSGVMTFVVNHDGVVYQKDLGPKTATIAKAMKTFNPDKTWTRVESGGVGQP